LHFFQASNKQIQDIGCFVFLPHKPAPSNFRERLNNTKGIPKNQGCFHTGFWQGYGSVSIWQAAFEKLEV